MTTKDTETHGGTTPGDVDEGSTRTLSTSRRRVLLAAGAVVLVAALLALMVNVVGGDEERSASAAAGSSAPAAGTGAPASGAGGTAAPSEGQAEQAPDAEELPPAFAAVPLDAAAAVDDGIVVTLPRIESIEGVGQGPGNVAGPALRVTIRIENGTGEPVALDGVSVNMFYGSAATPASPLDDRSGQPFVGELPSGEAAEGVYVFSVPSDARDSVTVELGYRAGAPRVLFSGPVA